MEKSEKPVGVLFVCTGNICRSPTAEAVFRHQVRAAGLEYRFKIDSAGTHGYHTGDAPDQRAIDIALGRGVDMRDLRARKVKDSDFEAFDYILAMDSGHHDILVRTKGRAALSLFLDRADVPDPYYGPLRGFDQVYEMVEERCSYWLAYIRKKHGF